MPEKVFKGYTDSKIPLAKTVVAERKLLGIRGAGGPPGIAFLVTCLDFFYKKEHSKEELLECITDGYKDLSLCDMTVVHRDGIVDIFDVREQEDGVAASRIAEAKSALEGYFLKKPKSLDSCNEVLKRQLETAHKKGIKQVNLYFIRNKEGQIKGFERLYRKGLTSVQIITPTGLLKKRLRNDYLESCELSSDEEVIATESKGKVGYDSVVLKVRLSELLDIHNEHLAKGFDFFSDNVRNPKKRSVFAAGLEQTLKDEPDKFHLFHNGVTMTASNIEKTGATYKISEPQIVNGAQTLGNIADLVGQGKILADVNGACVLCKVVKANGELIDDICEASNTQKSVGVVDLRSNDNFQKELTLYINSIGNGRFTYIRKPMQGRRNATAITLDKLFQWAHSALRSRPHEAKNMKSRLFSKSRDEYKKISGEIKKRMGHMQSLCQVGLFVESKIKAMSDSVERGLARDMNNHLVARLYRIGIKKGKDTCNDIYFDEALALFRSAFVRAQKQNPYLDSGSFFKSKDSAKASYLN